MELHPRLALRRSGLLLHPTSLPSPHGLGDLGAEARMFADQLRAARQSWWQVLPLVPPAGGASPYTSSAAFATNPLLVDLRGLVALGLLEPSELEAAVRPVRARVDFGEAHAAKTPLLERAHARLLATPSSPHRAALEAWATTQAWLDDYALFEALHEAHDHRSWTTWPIELRDRKPAALAEARRTHATRYDYHRFTQWAFETQWQALRAELTARGVSVMGDIPIFVAHDSVDVWANRRCFQLDADGAPTFVAGVPPDYFAKDGQLWGNPLYDWAAQAEDGYAWWIERFRNAFQRYDAVRVDHFIGFYRAWHVDRAATTARVGTFKPGPREALFEAVHAALGPLPIVAEDLGVIVPGVWKLRERFGYPGMRILQFGFGDIERGNEHLPHEVDVASIAYTGTHDNDTTVGWYQGLTELVDAGGDEAGAAAAQREHVWRYLGGVPEKVHWAAIRQVLQCPATLAMFPVQDLLGLGSDARMNVPGVADGNWGWRLLPGQLDGDALRILGEQTTLFGRHPRAPRALPVEEQGA
jgi:4-alpha-glucanotransferase